MRFLRVLVAWVVIAFSAFMVLAALGDLLGGPSEANDTSTGVLWGMAVFFALTLYGGIWLLTGGQPRQQQLTRQVLAFVEKEKGRVTVAEVVLHCNISVEQTKKIMDHFIREGMARLEVTDQLQEVYVFEGLLPDSGPPSRL